jgi:hypothetical protein
MRSRRHFLRQVLTSAGAALLAGCDALSNSSWFPKLLGIGEHLSSGAQHLVTSRRSMAQEFLEADLSPQFRSNGTANPEDADQRWRHAVQTGSFGRRAGAGSAEFPPQRGRRRVAHRCDTIVSRMERDWQWTACNSVRLGARSVAA